MLPLLHSLNFSMKYFFIIFLSVFLNFLLHFFFFLAYWLLKCKLIDFHIFWILQFLMYVLFISNLIPLLSGKMFGMILVLQFLWHVLWTDKIYPRERSVCACEECLYICYWVKCFLYVCPFCLQCCLSPLFPYWSSIEYSIYYWKWFIKASCYYCILSISPLSSAMCTCYIYFLWCCRE